MRYFLPFGPSGVDQPVHHLPLVEAREVEALSDYPPAIKLLPLVALQVRGVIAGGIRWVSGKRWMLNRGALSKPTTLMRQ
jgi:hypothetical protein